MVVAHPFNSESERGLHGGIMDYTCSANNAACGSNTFAQDGRIDGEWQFNTEKNKANICTDHLGPLITVDTCAAITAYVAECGNGIVEGTEQCECQDKSATCSKCLNCMLTNGAVCSPEAWGIHSQCCTSDGAYEDFAETCDISSTVQGYCAQVHQF